MAVAIEAKAMATNNKNDVDSLKVQQEENINKFNNILGIANEGNERSKVNTQRLDLIQGKAEAAYNQIGRIDTIQGEVNTWSGRITELRDQVNPLIGNVNNNTADIGTLIVRMNDTEGKANGADQRSLLNSEHIEELYAKVYENANKHINYYSANPANNDYELRPNTINMLHRHGKITITPEKIETNLNFDGIFYYKYDIINMIAVDLNVTIKIINIDDTSEFIEKTITIPKLTDNINTSSLELYIINEHNYYFTERDSDYNPVPSRESILIKEVPIKTYNYPLN